MVSFAAGLPGAFFNQSEWGGTAPHGIHTSLGALGWGAGCVGGVVSVPGGVFRSGAGYSKKKNF